MEDGSCWSEAEGQSARIKTKYPALGWSRMGLEPVPEVGTVRYMVGRRSSLKRRYKAASAKNDQVKGGGPLGEYKYLPKVGLGSPAGVHSPQWPPRNVGMGTACLASSAQGPFRKV